MNQKILITGARGFLGSTLMLTLQAAGYKPVAFEGDIRDREHVLKVLEDVSPSAVIHAAAKADVGECERDPALAQAVNVEGARNIVDACKAAGAKLIFISSTSVFSGHSGNYKEEDKAEPLNVYSRTKLEGEALVGANEQGTIVRLLLLGVRPDGAPGKNFFEWVMRSAQENKDLQLFNDQFVNHISNWSTAQYLQKILELPQVEKVVHLGTSDVLSKAELARMILKRFPEYRGTLKEISVEEVADKVVRPKQMWLNVDRAAKLFGPMPTTEQELKTIWSKM
jgi:dTDP-4-dehydrorhamnose reductase